MRKNLYLFRGIPGAGKSTTAEALAHKLECPVLSADMFFEQMDGSYKFDASKLGQAHAWCRNQTENNMKQEFENIIVANTFTTEKEMKPYMILAESNGYSVHRLIVENHHGNMNIHNVPSDTILKMLNRFSIKLVPTIDAPEVDEEVIEETLWSRIKKALYNFFKI